MYSIYKVMLFQAKESRNELVSLYLSKLHLVSEDEEGEITISETQAKKYL